MACDPSASHVLEAFVSRAEYVGWLVVVIVHC
jgi:hypothetical protein